MRSIASVVVRVVVLAMLWSVPAWPRESRLSPEQELFRCVHRLYGGGSGNTGTSTDTAKAAFRDLNGNVTRYLVRTLDNLTTVVAPFRRAGQQGLLVVTPDRVHFVRADLCRTGGPYGGKPPAKRNQPIIHRFELDLGVRGRYLELRCFKDDGNAYELKWISASESPDPDQKKGAYKLQGPNDSLGKDEIRAVQNLIIARADSLKDQCQKFADRAPAPGKEVPFLSREGLALAGIKRFLGGSVAASYCELSADNGYAEVRNRLLQAQRYCHARLAPWMQPGAPGAGSEAGSGAGAAKE